MSVAFVTSTPYRELDPDLPLLLAAARAAGHEAALVVWDDPTVDWGAWDHVILRSTWDYVPRRDEFLAWARSVPHLRNDAATLTWNTDKTYLRELAHAGVDIIETRWSVRRGEPIGDGPEWVVKPTVSAGSAHTARWSTPDQVWDHSERLLAAGRASMVQPYVPTVDDEGETALLFFGGRFSHAIRKGAMLSPGHGEHDQAQMREPISPRQPSAAQLAAAHHVLDVAARFLPRAPVYARVDVVSDPDGTVRLMELELAEPSLFLDHAPGSADRAVAAILAP